METEKNPEKINNKVQSSIPYVDDKKDEFSFIFIQPTNSTAQCIDIVSCICNNNYCGCRCKEDFTMMNLIYMINCPSCGKSIPINLNSFIDEPNIDSLHKPTNTIDIKKNDVINSKTIDIQNSDLSHSDTTNK